MHSILVVDDDKDMRLLLTRFLTKSGYEANGVGSGADALAWLQNNKPDLVLSDFRLDDTTGTQLLAAIKHIHPSTCVIIITGYSDVKDAVEVMKLGAYDYVTKPLFPDEILLTIKNALSATGKNKVALQSSGKKQQKSSKAKVDGFLLGKSKQFKTIMRQVELVAPTNFSVIIYGESGSGKEMIAKQIHMLSNRAEQPFVAIDCGALSKELAGSELFGHEKGAFTGAINQKTGSLELANGGTIFLDEIGNLSYDIQVSLLRVIQERKIRRVGGLKDIDIDVRIIIASNEKLWDLAKNGRFREDLYHRFNEFSIEIPPLRERSEDVMLFAHHFLSQTNKDLNKNIEGFAPDVEVVFKSYVWYGNLRELKNVVKRATLLTDGPIIEIKSLPFEITNHSKLQFDAVGAVDSTKVQPAKALHDNPLKAANIDAEYEVILEALKQSDFNKSKAAKLLNIDRKTLYNKMKQFKEFNQ